MSDDDTSIEVTGAPERIWLNLGELEESTTFDAIESSGEVTWCADRQDACDIEYVRADLAIAAQAPQAGQEMEAKDAEAVGEIVAEDMGRPFNAIRIRCHFYAAVPAVGTKLYVMAAAAIAAQGAQGTGDKT